MVIFVIVNLDSIFFNILSCTNKIRNSLLTCFGLGPLQMSDSEELYILIFGFAVRALPLGPEAQLSRQLLLVTGQPRVQTPHQLLQHEARM